MTEFSGASRRMVLAAGLSSIVLPPTRVRASPARQDLHFTAWRNDQAIGIHNVGFSGNLEDFTVSIDADMLVKLGPIPIFRYRHHASETWRAGHFVQLESHTVSNGRQQHVLASQTSDGVSISTDDGRNIRLPSPLHPLTHWNPKVLEGPLFNPQTGALLREKVSRSDGQTSQTTRYVLHGDAEIIDWYDAGGTWSGLRGKAPDGSYLDYRRSA